ncbi:MAG: type II toxin-antitoxin system Phd/YefM family antitoxin [Candidatus Kerfeldbacteria bacterium]|nr:type II toxin-antitoxin system Phd/YefM family antitoxin [Candidatus Kerfeldbacteria bacterium]
MVTKTVSALTARTQFGQIMQRAKQKDERFIVDRRGEPQVVILSIRDYINAIAPASVIAQSMRKSAKRKGLNRLTMRQINSEIRAVRKEASKKRKKK